MFSQANKKFNIMKKLFLAAAAMLMSVSMNAQNEVGQISIAPTVGLNISSITDYDSSKSKAGLAVGAVAEYGIAEKFGVSAGLMFSMQGCGWDRHDEKKKLNYLNIPILANYYVYKGLAVKAGVQPGILLSAKEGDEDIKDETKGFDLSIPVGASYEYKNFVLDARYNIGVTKGNKEGSKSHKNSVFQITLGYKFKL